MAEEETITFEYIREIQREEQKIHSLSKIPEDFFDKVKIYLRHKEHLSKRKKDADASMEMRNIRRILEDIFNRRETKIMEQAIISVRTGIIPENLTESEKEFFEAVVDFLKRQRERTINKLFEKSDKKKDEETEEQEIEFLEDVEDFIGIDLKKYGPYHKGDIVFVPKENAQLFIKTGKAKEIEGE